MLKFDQTPMTETDVIDASLHSRELLDVLLKFKRGDFSVRLPFDAVGLPGKIYDTLNDILELNAAMATELKRVGSAVGKEGKISQREALPAATGSWRL